MNDKESLLNRYSESKTEAYDILKKLNTFDGIKILLSFMEALDGELNKELFQLETSTKKDNTLLYGMIEHTSSSIAIIREMLAMLLLFSNSEKTELNRTPVILTSLVTNEEDPIVQNWINNEFDVDKDGMFTATLRILKGTYRVKRFILIKDLQNITGKDQIQLIIELLRKYGDIRTVQTLLRNNTPSRITLDEKFSIDNTDSESPFYNQDMHPRKLNTYEKFPFWKEDLSSISKEGLFSTQLSVHSPKQRTMQDLEHNKFFEEFIRIPEISKTFETKFNISLTKFRDITLAIKRVALSSQTYVVSLPKPRLVSKLKKLSGCSKSEIEQILNLFILKKGDPVFAKYIIYNGFECIYSWSLITFPLDNMMSELYDKWVDGNTKGIEFEKNCRKILVSCSCQVFDDRLSLPSLNTDIDVLGVKNNMIFVIECKSETRKHVRANTQLHQFEKYYERLLAKAKWISVNYSQFSKLLKTEKFIITNKIQFIVPLLVSRIYQSTSEKLLTISPNELQEIIDNYSSIKDNQLELTLNSKTVIKTPVFPINNSNDIVNVI